MSAEASDTGRYVASNENDVFIIAPIVLPKVDQKDTKGSISTCEVATEDGEW